MANSKLKCTGCKDRFPREQMIRLPSGPYHSYDCAVESARRKAPEVAEKLQKKRDRERKAKLDDTVPNWTKKAQKAFNWFIRERDFDLPCVSCRRHDSEIKYSGVGGKFDAGHLRTRGAHPELRFCEDNCFKQCKKCNGGSGRFSHVDASISESFKNEARRRIGGQRFDFLMGPHEPKRYRVEELKEIAKHYNRLARELKRQRND